MGKVGTISQRRKRSRNERGIKKQQSGRSLEATNNQSRRRSRRPKPYPEARGIPSGVSDEGKGDALSGETADVEAISKADVTPIDRFPFWDVAGTATDTEAVAHPRGLFPLPDFTDQLANIGGQQNDQADAITGETTNTENVGGMSGGGIFTGGTGTTESWYNGVKVSRYESAGLGANEDLEFFRREATEITPRTETFSPLEFDVAAPLVTDQHAMGCQLEAVGSNVCEQLKGVVPECDLPFGCN